MRVEVDSLLLALYSVGMTGFEPATTRPPDEYSNRAELHPECSWRLTAWLCPFCAAKIRRRWLTTKCLAKKIKPLLNNSFIRNLYRLDISRLDDAHERDGTC